MAEGKPVSSVWKRIALFADTEVLDIAEHIDKIVGFLTIREGMALYHLAAFGPGEGAAVEIGSFQGKSAVWLAHGTLHRKRGRVVAVDPHVGSWEHQPGAVCGHMMPSSGSTLAAFNENLKRFSCAHIVEAKVMPSLEAAAGWTDEPIRLLFIDGAHEFEAVRSDFLAWFPKVVPGGIIALHDVNGEGPKALVETRIVGNPSVQIVGRINSMLVVEKLF